MQKRYYLPIPDAVAPNARWETFSGKDAIGIVFTKKYSSEKPKVLQSAILPFAIKRSETLFKGPHIELTNSPHQHGSSADSSSTVTTSIHGTTRGPDSPKQASPKKPTVEDHV